MKEPALAPPRLRIAHFDDYEKIRRFHAFDFLPLDDWRRLWLDNPLWPRLGKNFPIGWVLETQASEIVGTLGIVPSLYKVCGTDLVSALAMAWSVASPYRGYALWLMDEYFNQPGVDLSINTTVGSEAIEPINRWCTRIPLGDWQRFHTVQQIIDVLQKRRYKSSRCRSPG